MAALEAKMAANDQRTDDAMGRLRELRGSEETHAALSGRLDVLERTGRAESEAGAAKQNRVWLLIIGLITGIICPVIVTAVITIIHLRTLH